MKYFIIILLSFLSITTAKAQSGLNSDEMVGFACAYAGSPSKTVDKVSKLIDKEEYQTIIKLLDSKNNAERFLAVIICEKLIELKKLTSTKEMSAKILDIYNSNDKVSVCSGCTYWDTMTLKNILLKSNHIRVSAQFWLDQKFKKKN